MGRNIKKCPLCGADNNITYNTKYAAFITSCTNNDCMLSQTFGFWTEKEAISALERRNNNERRT